MIEQIKSKTNKKKVISQYEETSKQFLTLPQPQEEPIRAPKAKNDPKIMSKSKAIIEGTLENKVIHLDK